MKYRDSILGEIPFWLVLVLRIATIGFFLAFLSIFLTK